MKLSIIIPAYNVENYIVECLSSLMFQLTSETELIIIDDCSTDRTALLIRKIIKPYQDKITFVPFVKNQGVSAARNKGLELAKGDYIAFIDGDDSVSSEYINSIFYALKSNCDVYKLSWAMSNKVIIYRADKLPDWNCSVWSRILRKDLIKHQFQVGLNFGEDGLFLGQNVLSHHSVGYILNVIYKYRNGRIGSLTNTYLEGKK